MMSEAVPAAPSGARRLASAGREHAFLQSGHPVPDVPGEQPPVWTLTYQFFIPGGLRGSLQQCR